MVEDQLEQEIWTAPLELVDKVSNLYIEGRLQDLCTHQRLKEITQRSEYWKNKIKLVSTNDATYMWHCNRNMFR